MLKHIIQKGYRNLILVALFFPLSALAQQADTLDILFVGNSYTYFWNLPQHVNLMAASQGRSFASRQSTAGGSNWEHHLQGERDLRSVELIRQEGWEYVVLQNHSMSTLNRLAEFRKNGKTLISMIRKAGAEPVLYMTWAREFNPLMQDPITSGYLSLAKAERVSVVPVGLVWAKVRALRPDLKLFDPDGSHPSPVGTYLNALIFYRFFSGAATAEIPNRLQTTDKDGEKTYLNFLTQNDADFLQQVVDLFDFSAYKF